MTHLLSRDQSTSSRSAKCNRFLGTSGDGSELLDGLLGDAADLPWATWCTWCWWCSHWSHPRTSTKHTTLVQEQQTETAAERQLSRQEQLRAHAAQRAAVIKLQQQHARGLQLPVRAESTRSFNLQPQAQSQPLNLFNENPFVTGLDRAAGTYTISY